MPLYEYECGACGVRFEIIQKFSDPPASVCTKCGQGPVHKLLSAPAFHFKGTGWYITDYARKGDGATTPPSGPSAPGSTGPGSSSDKSGSSEKSGSSDSSGSSDKTGSSEKSGSTEKSGSSEKSNSSDSSGSSGKPGSSGSKSGSSE
jgi:putative FmdB family regulatory protein